MSHQRPLTHTYIGLQWRFDTARTASYFPACSCGWYTDEFLGQMTPLDEAAARHAEHVAQFAADPEAS